MVPPPPPAPPAPDTQLSLEWVYGYSSASCRASACYFSATGGNGAAATAGGASAGGSGGGGGVGVVYPAGKVAVVLSQPLDEEGAEAEGDRVQSFMQEHTDEITALAVSPCGKWVATGEAGAHPKVRKRGGWLGSPWGRRCRRTASSPCGAPRCVVCRLLGMVALAWFLQHPQEAPAPPVELR